MSDLPLADQIFWFIFCGLVGVIVLALKYQYYKHLTIKEKERHWFATFVNKALGSKENKIYDKYNVKYNDKDNT